MKKRGKILRDTSAGSGLLIVEGQQYPFSLGGAWRSNLPPAAGMPVEVEFGSGGEILAIRCIPESPQTGETPEAMAVVREVGGALISKLVARFGSSRLMAFGLLLVSWFCLSAFSIQMPYGSFSFTFWDCLRFLNSQSGLEAAMAGARNQPGPGFLGLVALSSLAGPFLHEFWKDKRAFLAGLLPLVFMATVALLVRAHIRGSVGQVANGPFGELARQLRDEVVAAVSMGFGAYLGGGVSVFFGAIALRRFTAETASQNADSNSARRAAA